MLRTLCCVLLLATCAVAETREEASRVAKHHQEEQVNDSRIDQNDQRGHPGLLRAPGHRKTGRLGGV